MVTGANSQSLGEVLLCYADRMNISLVCVATNASGSRKLQKRFEAAVDYIEQFFPASGRVIKHVGDTHLYNSEGLGDTWKTPCTFEDERGFYSLSQPTVPVNEHVSESTYWPAVANLVAHRKFEELLPNYFGIHLGDQGDVLVWSDLLGLGRCYIVEGDIIAISNHIGVLSFFLDTPLEIDRVAVAKYAGSSFYFGNETPYRQIKRIPPASMLSLRHGRKQTSVYANYESLFEKTDQNPDYDGTAHQLSTVANNISSIAARTPVVSLSGGRDSRMTSAVMLSAGLPLTLKTIDTWSEEADIAKRLIALYREKNPHVNLEHQVVEPRSVKVTQSLEERLRRAFIMWDGDALQNRINGNLSFPREANRLNISGVSGEIMRGVYWGGEGQMEKFEKTEDFLQRRLPALLGTVRLSAESRNAVTDEVEKIVTTVQRTGWEDDVRGFDVLYFIAKNRRWPPQALNAHSPMILSAPSFVRASFNLTKADKLEQRMIPELLQRTIPEWTTVPTFRATGQKAKEMFAHGTATFQTDPGGFLHLIGEKSFWPHFFNEEIMEKYLENIHEGIQTPAEVAWLNKAIWVEYLEEHTKSLNMRVSKAVL